MLELNLPVNESKEFNNFSLKEKGPINKLNLRGKANNKDFTSTVGKILGVILPNSPNEWLITSNNIIKNQNNNYELENILYENVSENNLGSVTNITDQFTIFALIGSNISEVFSKSSPFNFDKLKNNYSAQTILNNIDITIIKKDNENVDLLVRRSFANHLWLWLCDSARFL